MTDETPVRALIQALRSPLPPTFEWDLRFGDTCAMQVAVDAGILTDDEVPDADKALENLGITPVSSNPFDANELGGVVPLYGVPARDVTPQMVADALERLAQPRSATVGEAQPSGSPQAMPLVAEQEPR